MHEPTRQPFSRRTTLLAGAVAPVVIGTAGCTVRNPLEDRPEPDPVPVDPDLGLRDAARGAIAAQTALLRSTVAVRPRLAGLVDPLLTLHGQHLDALPGARTSDPTRAPAPGPADRWADVVAGERALQRQLAGFAQRAESGSFARLLASMAAATAQGLAR